MSELTLRERARKAALLLFPGQDEIRKGLREACEIGHLVGYPAALEDAAKMVCPWCRRSEPFNGRGHYLDGREMPCYADTIHAALAAEADKDKGEERT